MTTPVDLRELAIDRGTAVNPELRARRHILTRYVLPMLLLCGFVSLLLWAAWDILFPPKTVRVMPVLTSTAEIQQEGTPLFQAAGWIEPRPTPVRVAALAPGVVEELLVVEDQAVAEGEAIAELVKDDARLVKDRAMADLKLREAELEEAEATLRAAMTRFKQPVHLQAALGEAEANLAKIVTELKNLPFDSRRADAEYDAARKDYEGKLAARDVVAGIEIDKAKSKMDSARALVEGLRDRMESLTREREALIQRRDALQTQLELLADETKAKDESGARVLAAKARIAQAQVALAEAQLQLDRMTIRAPIAGRIYRLIGHPGARVGTGSSQSGSDASSVVTMYDHQMLQVRVDVRFEDIPKVQLQQPVEIDNAALEAPIRGNVLFISSQANIQKNTLDVKVAVPNPPAVFKPEMLVDVTFLAPHQPARESTPQQKIRLLVLQSLIHQAEDGAFVWVADQSEGIARRIRVETGETGSNGLVEIKSGLNATSRIISSGTELLEDGDRIRIAGEDSSQASAPLDNSSEESHSSHLSNQGAGE